jgi:hypothetical protein
MVSLVLTGLIGGGSHCAGMCGPFVLSQVASRLEALPVSRMSEWRRLTGAAVLPYQLGRATTYATLGGLGAGFAGTMIDTRGLHWLSAALLLAAAVAMLGMAVPALKRYLVRAPAGEGWWSRHVGRWAGPLFANPVGWRGYALGVMLGFIPCGLLYAALLAATAAGNAVTGALGMLAFAVGTMPSLVAVGLVGHLAGQRWRRVVVRYAPVLLLLNAGALTVLAWRHVV